MFSDLFCSGANDLLVHTQVKCIIIIIITSLLLLLLIGFLFVCLFNTVDQIYHLASPASPPNYMYNPIKTLKTNTIGTLNMLGEYVYLLNEYSFYTLDFKCAAQDCSVFQKPNLRNEH